jgi:HAD superfamily hydrolase (TIGR01450 family)
MDGTLIMGEQPIEGAFDTLRYLEAKGKRVVFVSNNSSHSHNDYVVRLAKLGYNATPEQIVTAGIATAHYLASNYPYKSLFVLGTESLKRMLREYGLEVREVDEPADIVVLALDTELTFKKLFHATKLLERGAKYIATHPDLMCPTEEGNMPDAGAFIAAVKATIDKKPEVIIGKPCAPIANYVFECRGVNPAEAVFIGDRLYTDILFGIKHGMLSALVLTGEATPYMVMESSIKPDFIWGSVKDLRELV